MIPAIRRRPRRPAVPDLREAVCAWTLKLNLSFNPSAGVLAKGRSPGAVEIPKPFIKMNARQDI
jgi:hypothetical protein